MRYFLLLTLTTFLTNFSFAQDPVLLFSDIESGPKSGWSAAEPSKGAAVTVWGKNFGATRGSSFISVNGTQLTSNDDYATWSEFFPTPFYQRITFWLNDAMADGLGDIMVTVDGVESNPLPFTIREGEIHFISASNPSGIGSEDDPFDVADNVSHWIDSMAAGDIYYFRDSLVYDQEANGGNSCIWIRPTEAHGTADLPIALLAYPTESPTFEVLTYNINFSNAIKFDNSYMVFSGFHIDCEWMGAALGGDFHRFVGNDVIGLKNYYASGTGIVVTGNINSHTGDGNVLLGNAIHGGNSQNRFDHGVYFSGCADNGGSILGWNYFYDNDFGRGPIISINHQGDRCQTGQILDAHFVFNNIVDCSAQRATAINVYDLSYDTGEEAPEPTYVYNNVFINSGTYDGTDLQHVGYAPAMIHNAVGDARFYHNTLYNSGYVAFSSSAQVSSTIARNNIFHMTQDFPGPTGNHYLSVSNDTAVHLSNNLYFGNGAYSNCLTCAQDTNNVSDLDPMFVDGPNFNFELLTGSPAIGAGTGDLTFEIAPPSYAPINRDMNFTLRNPVPSIGAYAHPIGVGLDENDQAEEVLIYPNPTTGSIWFGSDEIEAIDVFDFAGKHVLTLTKPRNQLNLDLESGVYILRTQQENSTLSQKLIMR